MEWEYEMKLKIWRIALLRLKEKYRAPGLKNWRLGWLEYYRYGNSGPTHYAWTYIGKR